MFHDLFFDRQFVNIWVIIDRTLNCFFEMKNRSERLKIIYIIDPSAYFGPRVGCQFEGYPLPSSKLGSSWLSVSIFLECLVGTLWV
jgi:hypothetical protein